MKIAILLGLARQVEGERHFINVIKADQDPEKLRRYLVEADLPLTATYEGIPCVVEYGIISDVEIEV